MHMADALISPAVGGVMIAASAGVAAYSVRNIQAESDDKKVPLMGVMGAFVFAAQMINFAIPGTGSSGHIGGGLLLAVMLGADAGFIVMASVLVIQALFFADGGLLALGCNIFNLGFFPCYIGYNFIYRPIVKNGYSSRNVYTAVILAAVVALQLGSFCVVAQTVLSGRTGFSFSAFLLLMQPIHLAIGLVEGVVTASIILFVHKTSPALIAHGGEYRRVTKKMLAAVLAAAVIIGGVLSYFASTAPDGLEWSVEKMEGAGNSELQ